MDVVAISDPDLKHRIRMAAEAEEHTNYVGERMNDEWQRALGPLGTDEHKEFLEWISMPSNMTAPIGRPEA